MKAIITSSEIIRKSGYGQYSIIIDMLIDGEHEVTHSFHTTDSQLFDDSKDNDFYQIKIQ